MPVSISCNVALGEAVKGLSNFSALVVSNVEELEKMAAARLLLLDVLADFRAADAAAGRGTVAQEFLNPPRTVDFASVQIPFPICGHHVRPMELACLAAAGSDAAQLRQILPVDDINRVVGKVGDVHAALLRIGGKVDRAGRAGRSLWSDVEFADETAFARLAVRIGTGLPRLRGPEHLHAVIAAVADVEQAVAGQFGAVHRAAEKLRLHLAALELGRPGTDALADIGPAAVLDRKSVVPVCAKMPHVFAGGRIHNEYAPVSVTVGDVHEARSEV